MSTLRITNIEAKADPSSPTVDEKIKLTNSNGDILVHIDGKTSGITTIGINTTAGNIKFDQNSNVVVTGIITATKFVGTIEPTSLEIGSNIKLGNAGVITATSYVGDGSALTGITGTTINNNADNRLITGSGTANTLEGEANLTFNGSKLVLAANSTAYDAFQVGDGLFIGNTTNNVSAAIFHQGGGADLEIGSQDMITFTTGNTAGNATERLRITSNGMVRVTDSASLTFGNNDDMRIFHDGGSANYIDVYNKDLYIRCNRDSGITGGDIVLQPKSGENSAIFRDNGNVELYYDNALKLETVSNGTKTTGRIFLNGTNGGFDYNNTAHTLEFLVSNGSTHSELTHNAYVPSASGTRHLGYSNKRWDTLYVDKIAFGGSANTDQHSLDDYEEGTWTPTITGLGNHNNTGGSTWGKYTKIGNRVFITFRYQWTSRTTTNGGVIFLGSLPFSSTNDSRSDAVYIGGLEGVISNTGREVYGGQVVHNTNTIQFRASGHNVSENSLFGSLSTSMSSGYIYGGANYIV